MRKIQLSIETLAVESFATAEIATAQGTVFGNEPTRGNNQACASAVDACPSRLCDTNIDCPIHPSAYDACPTGFCVPA